MIKNIVWSPSAETDLENILDYLSKHWENAVIIEFLAKMEILIHQINRNERLFPQINKSKNIRKCVLTKHNTLIYRESKTTLEILRIFDTRQNPKSLKI